MTMEAGGVGGGGCAECEDPLVKGGPGDGATCETEGATDAAGDVERAGAVAVNPEVIPSRAALVTPAAADAVAATVSRVPVAATYRALTVPPNTAPVPRPTREALSVAKDTLRIPARRKRPGSATSAAEEPSVRRGSSGARAAGWRSSNGSVDEEPDASVPAAPAAASGAIGAAAANASAAARPRLRQEAASAGKPARSRPRD